DPLVHAHQVRRGVASGPQTARAQHGVHVGRHRSLAVGARHQQDRVGALRMPQPVHQRAHGLEAELHAQLHPRREVGDGGVIGGTGHGNRASYQRASPQSVQGRHMTRIPPPPRLQSGVMEGGARILVVDDLPENREILTGLLEPEGYTVLTAKDGQEALERALADPPDLILMDVSMPRMTGFEACRRLKADERTRLVPLVLVTGLVAREDRIQGIAAGCDDFLTKPVDSEQLVARTRSLLRAKALIDDLETAENVLVSLATALDAKDNYTRGHSERVAEYAEQLGGALGLGHAERRNLRRAGLLHDIGKIGTRLDYLQKPGPLTASEYE